MALLVQKYGGTSVGSIERIDAVAERIIHAKQQGHKVVVVVSAMAGETNRLLDLAANVDSNASRRELDVLVTVGEQVSASLLAMTLVKKGYSALSLLSDQVGINTDSHFGKARITHIDTHVLEEHLEHGRIPIVTGFQGRDIENNVTSLGRGGTDTSAVAIAAALQANECQIYTDVDGVFTTDPRIEPEARLLPKIQFEEMIELASLGAKVLQKRCVELAGKYKVKLRVLSSFGAVMADDFGGTLISYEDDRLENLAVTGIASNADEAVINFSGMAINTCTPADILHRIAEQNIEVDMIVQTLHTFKQENNANRPATIDFAFTLAASDYDLAMTAINDLLQENQNISIDNVQGRRSVAKISIVGVGMRSHAGVASKMLTSLADEHIPVDLISTSEIKISVLIERKYMELAIRCLHQAFQLAT